MLIQVSSGHDRVFQVSSRYVKLGEVRSGYVRFRQVRQVSSVKVSAGYIKRVQGMSG
jgi:hypothetical protein